MLLERLYASYVAEEAWQLMRTELVWSGTGSGRVVEHLKSALAANPLVVLCRGEPGIGKTRMAAMWAFRWRGIPRRNPAAPPYWPWRQVLRAMSASVDIVKIADELKLISDVVRLAPDVFGAVGMDRGGSGSNNLLRGGRLPYLGRSRRIFHGVLAAPEPVERNCHGSAAGVGPQALAGI